MKTEKGIVKEHFDLMDKRDEILKAPMNSLTKMALDDLGHSEIEKRVEKHYAGFTLTQFLEATSVKTKNPK